MAEHTEDVNGTQSDEIKRLRRSAGLTQAEAAEKVDANPRTFASWERGERSVSYEKMLKIRRVLGKEANSLDTGLINADSKSVKRYKVAEPGDNPSTVLIDTSLIDVEGGMPNPEHAEAHSVNTRWMGPWMQSELAIVESRVKIDGPGRYVLRWSEGEDKVVVEAWRYGDDKVCIRTHAPREKTVFLEVERQDGYTLFRREDGTDVKVEVIGRVVFPDADVQLMTEGMADTAARIVNGHV